MRGRFEKLAMAGMAAGIAFVAPAAAQQAKPAAPKAPPVLISPLPRPAPGTDGTRPPTLIPRPPASVSPAPPRPSVITAPRWARQPRVEFPERALARGVHEGRASVSCGILPTGSLTDCRVELEDPVGAGFGAAAIEGALATGRLAPDTVTGAAPNARARWTVRFSAPEAPTLFAILEDPRWAVPPRPVMPRSARRARIERAEVRLDCEIVPGFGRMRNCRVIQDGPEGHGFGQAAIQAVRGASIAPEPLQAAAPNAHAVFTVTFQR